MSFQNELKEIEKRMNKDAHIILINLFKWLYVNHKDVLREWEKTQGNLQIEFLGKDEKKEEKETTFKDTFNFLETHGWERLNVKQYNDEKRNKKYFTARIGFYGFFKLKRSIKEIEEGENFSCGNCKSPVKFNQKFCSQCGEKQLWGLFG